MCPKLDYQDFLKSNENTIRNYDICIVVTFYKFFDVSNLFDLQTLLNSILSRTEIKGTILLANEGINGTISGKKNEISEALESIWKIENLTDLKPKFSLAPKNPFFRMKIKFKKEIVTLGIKDVSPNYTVGKYIEPEKWNELISDENLLLIDTRNDYEVSIGTFENALNPNIKNFREFPNWVSENLIKKDPEIKNKKIAMFCTGGIRCEKSTSYLKSLGFKNVFHLEGGILKYLEKIPEKHSKWNGSCFVFDYRVSVQHNLKLSNYDMCFACRMPINEEDKKHNFFVQGESCHHCYNVSNKKQKQKFKERQKQIKLSKLKNKSHIGIPNIKSKIIKL